MKLSDAQLHVLRAIDGGEVKPKARRVTLVGLWRAGMIADAPAHHPATQMHGHKGWMLTKLGLASLNAGRLMVSKRLQD